MINRVSGYDPATNICWQFSSDSHLYLRPPTPEEAEPLPDLNHLKAEMAAAHPDRGGSNAKFIAARARYVAARRRTHERSAS